MHDDEAQRALAAFLEPRQPRGWRYEPDDKVWCFGLADAALLVANVDSGRIHLIDYDADEVLYFDDVEQFGVALPDREAARRGLTNLQKEILTSTVPIPADTLADYQRQLAEQDRALEGEET